MAKIAGIRGVTYEHRDGSFRLRWFETHETATGPKRKPQYWTVHDESEVAVIARDIRASLDAKGYWVAPSGGVRPMDRNLEVLSVEWLDAVGKKRRHAPNTRSALKFALIRFWTALRHVEGLGADDALGVSLLTTDSVEKVCARLNEVHGAGTVYQTMHPVVCEFWLWATDKNIPLLEPAPRDTKSLLPPNPGYMPPPELPSLDEIDAMLSLVSNERALVAGVIMRATGLRIEQVSYVQGRHLDEAAATLIITKGKSRREHGMMRKVPLPRWLIPMLKRLGVWRRTWLIQHMDRYGEMFDERMRSPRNLSMYFRAAWNEAEAAGMVREQIWVPLNRQKASTTHSIRAQYQDFLMEQGVQEFVIDYLVGHSPRSTRGRSYANPPMRLLREAVDLIPPVTVDTATEELGRVLDFRPVDRLRLVHPDGS